METKKTWKSFSPEVRDRAVRMARERGGRRLGMRGDFVDRLEDRLHGRELEAINKTKLR